LRVSPLLYGLSVWAYVALAFIYSLVVFMAAISWIQFLFPVICSAKTARKEIASLSTYGPRSTLHARDSQGAQGFSCARCFFCIGNRIAGNEELLKEVDRQGDIIGNHSFSHHFWFDLFPAEKVTKDAHQWMIALLKVIGRNRDFQATLWCNQSDLKKAVFAGRLYTAVGWNIRSLDTVISDVQKLLNRVYAGLHWRYQPFFTTHSRTTLNIWLLIRHVKAKGMKSCDW
jgi:hypothetical protein